MPKRPPVDAESRELLYANWQERLRKRLKAILRDWDRRKRLIKAECDRDCSNGI
jgi:hypothetical protein